LGILAKIFQTTPSGVERIFVDSKNIANGDHEEDPTNDSSKEKTITKYFQKRKSIATPNPKLAKKASFAKLLS
jgi:hypothetical protein